jgi:DNA-directed RNA polymerase alpha subunit
MPMTDVNHRLHTMGFSRRVRCCLREYRIKSRFVLRNKTEADLKKIVGLHTRGLNEIKEVLAQHGDKLRE